MCGGLASFRLCWQERLPGALIICLAWMGGRIKASSWTHVGGNALVMPPCVCQGLTHLPAWLPPQITPDWEKLTAKVEADPDLVKTLGWVS